MIDKKCISEEWINDVFKRLNIADKVLAEKVIQALMLLESLSESGLNYVFKGGTATMLRLGSIRRMSIDIDIITEQENFEFTAILGKSLEKYGFTLFKEDPRKENPLSTIKKKHFKAYYKSAVCLRRDDECYARCSL